MKGHSNLWWWKWTWRRVPQLCEVQLEAPTLTVIYLHHLMSPSYFSVPFPSQPWMLKLQVQSDKDDIYFHIIIHFAWEISTQFRASINVTKAEQYNLTKSMNLLVCWRHSWHLSCSSLHAPPPPTVTPGLEGNHVSVVVWNKQSIRKIAKYYLMNRINMNYHLNKLQTIILKKIISN